MRAIGWLLLALLLLASGVWGLLLLLYAGPGGALMRSITAGLMAMFVVAALLSLTLRAWRWRVLAIYAAVCAGLLGWWSALQPSNERDWQTDVAKLAFATIDGDKVTLHNIRNFDYRSEFDYTPHYYDKTFRLSELEGVDVVAVYWMGPAVAHIFLSFAFAGDQHLAVSIETRKENDESYSTLKGFFRQYELYYVVADERDVIRLRTNYRHNPVEDVYVYRAAGPRENAINLFMNYVNEINRLNREPTFYNTLTTNCTTNIWFNTLTNRNHLPFNWKILVSGYLPELLYEHGRLATRGLDMAALQTHVHVNARAQAADDSADFSRLIRTPVSAADATTYAPQGVTP